MLNRSLILALFLCLITFQALSADVYAVAAGGLSTGTCSTPGTACTLTRASSFCAGNHVWLAGGTYTTGLRCVGAGTGDADSLRSIFEGLTDRSGANPVIIDGLEPTGIVNAPVRLTHNYGSVRNMILVVPEVAGTANRYGFYSENVTGSEVSNVEVYYKTTAAALDPAAQQWGIYIQGTSFKVWDNDVHHVNTGINVNTDTAIPTGTVLRNDIWDISVGNAEDADCINVGVTARDSSYGLLIESNTCREYRDDGVDLFGASKVIARFNTIGDPIDDTQSSNSCIKAGKDTSSGNIIIGNKCIHLLPHTGKNQYGLVTNGLSNGYILSNIFKVNLVGIQVEKYLAAGGESNVYANNTAIGGTYGLTVNSGILASTVKNNYLKGATADLNVSGVATGGFNFLANNTKSTSGTYTGTDLSGNPKFLGGENPTTVTGYKLFASSPLRGTGTNLNLTIGNYQDNGNRTFFPKPSIGAWEAASGDEAIARTTASTRTVRN